MYIPKGKIESKYYYTDGGQYKLSTNVEYVGFYHKDVYGNIWSGKEHTNESVQLTLFLPNVYTDSNTASNNNTIQYNKINQTANILGANAKQIISSNFSVNNTDYNNGYKARYFIKYNASTQLKIEELSQSSYNNLVSNPSEYHTIMYTLVKLLWRVRGPLEDQYKNNILIRPGVYSSNKRSVSEAEKTCPRISLYLSNLTDGAIIEP